MVMINNNTNNSRITVNIYYCEILIIVAVIIIYANRCEVIADPATTIMDPLLQSFECIAGRNPTQPFFPG